MMTLSEYLFAHLSTAQAEALLKLFADSDPLHKLKLMCPDAAVYYSLATALYSGSVAKLPKPDLNLGGIYPAIEEDQIYE